jgi:uncharacterized damage-inducible protein DinB
MGSELAKLVIEQSIFHLEHDFLPKIRRCLELLEEGDVWWRGSESTTTIGNLLLHLGGNVRQWIISGLGGAEDRRERAGEFAARGGIGKSEALALLERTVAEAAVVLRSLPAAELERERTIQGFRRTGAAALLHVVEHFSYHTGQIVWITKLRTGRDLKFYNL